MRHRQRRRRLRPASAEISKSINDNGLVAAAVLSGNRNFEGRVSPDVQANYLASPPLVVAYALAGTVVRDLATEPLATGSDGNPVYLKDIWPSNAEVQQFIAENITRDLFKSRYADVFRGDAMWATIRTSTGLTYGWDDKSTYVQNPPYFKGITKTAVPLKDIDGARVLALFGDKITTDHISPAGSIKAASPAGKYLLAEGVQPADFNQYGTRRGNHEVMMRGTFANIRIKNHMVRDEQGNVVEGGYTIHHPSGERLAIYDAAQRYAAEGVLLVVFAGIEYGNGSSRDWAAKGTNLLGVKAVIAQSFERIHRSNLVGMGIIPFVFQPGSGWEALGLDGSEKITLTGLADLRPRQIVEAKIEKADGTTLTVPLICRIDTLDELEYYRNGGILQYVLRNLAANRRGAGATGPGGGLILMTPPKLPSAGSCSRHMRGMPSPSSAARSPWRLGLAAMAVGAAAQNETAHPNAPTLGRAPTRRHRAVHQPGMRRLPCSGRAPQGVHRERERRRPDTAGRLLGLPRLEPTRSPCRAMRNASACTPNASARDRLHAAGHRQRRGGSSGVQPLGNRARHQRHRDGAREQPRAAALLALWWRDHHRDRLSPARRRAEGVDDLAGGGAEVRRRDGQGR